MKAQYLLSIITINLNNNRGLQKTLLSIGQQNSISYEHIIIDGDSNDESKETIFQYASRTPHLTYWISEKDNGVYSAMNKGIAQANGEYLLFLNSGDYLEPNILNQIKNQLTGEDIIYGDFYCCFANYEQKHLVTFPNPPLSATQIISPFFYLPHPATFIKKALFDNDKYSEQYKIVSDWEFWIKNILLKNCTIKHLSVAISNFADGGLSSNLALASQEKADVFNKLLPPKILESLNKLYTIEQSPMCEVILTINQTTRFQNRMKKLVLFCYKVHSIFTKRKK